MAIFGIGTILGPIMGPALGGWLTYDYSWRWVFYINLPVGVVCTLGILVFVHYRARFLSGQQVRIKMLGAPISEERLTLYGSFTSSSSYKPMLYLHWPDFRFRSAPPI
jgi:MFS family permease